MGTSDKILHELRAVVGDAEELLKETAGQTGERIEKARQRMKESLRRARQSARGLNERLREHPWPAVSLAALAGLIAGILLGRR